MAYHHESGKIVVALEGRSVQGTLAASQDQSYLVYIRKNQDFVVSVSALVGQTRLYACFVSIDWLLSLETIELTGLLSGLFGQRGQPLPLEMMIS